MSLLEVSGLRKAYAGRVILDLAELKLERGKRYLLTGSNGAGKTTLLRVLAGLEPAEFNRYNFEGSAIPPAEITGLLAPRIAYLHQHPYLFSSTVSANIGYGLKALGLPYAQRHARVEEALAWAGAQHLVHTAPHRLSGGERQRIALARIKVLNPDVLLLDEPTANLDEAARKQVAVLIDQLCDNNHCVVIATHDPELMALSDAVMLRLQNGSLARVLV